MARTGEGGRARFGRQGMARRGRVWLGAAGSGKAGTMTPLTIEIPGPPFSWQRVRADQRGGAVRFFESAQQRSWKGYAATLMLAARQRAGRRPADGPVRVTITALFPCPQKDVRKGSPAPERWSCSQKDVDNIAKAIGDAGNGVLWNDDRQVVDLHVRKRVAAQGSPPTTLVVVEEIDR